MAGAATKLVSLYNFRIALYFVMKQIRIGFRHIYIYLRKYVVPL